MGVKSPEELQNDLLSKEGIREKISLRAHELYVRRGGEPGRDLQDWVQAERDVLSPLMEQELRLSRETARRDDQKRDVRVMAAPAIQGLPEKQPISGGSQKSDAAVATRAKQTSGKPKSGS